MPAEAVVSSTYLKLVEEVGGDFARLTEGFIAARLAKPQPTEWEQQRMRYEIEPLDDGSYGIMDTLAHRPYANQHGERFKSPHKTFAEHTAKRLNDEAERARIIASRQPETFLYEGEG